MIKKHKSRRRTSLAKQLWGLGSVVGRCPLVHSLPHPLPLFNFLFWLLLSLVHYPTLCLSSNFYFDFYFLFWLLLLILIFTFSRPLTTTPFVSLQFSISALRSVASSTPSYILYLLIWKILSCNPDGGRFLFAACNHLFLTPRCLTLASQAGQENDRVGPRVYVGWHFDDMAVPILSCVWGPSG